MMDFSGLFSWVVRECNAQLGGKGGANALPVRLRRCSLLLVPSLVCVALSFSCLSPVPVKKRQVLSAWPFLPLVSLPCL